MSYEETVLAVAKGELAHVDTEQLVKVLAKAAVKCPIVQRVISENPSNFMHLITPDQIENELGVRQYEMAM